MIRGVSNPIILEIKKEREVNIKRKRENASRAKVRRVTPSDRRDRPPTSSEMAETPAELYKKTIVFHLLSWSSQADYLAFYSFLLLPDETSFISCVGNK